MEKPGCILDLLGSPAFPLRFSQHIELQVLSPGSGAQLVPPRSSVLPETSAPGEVLQAPLWGTAVSFPRDLVSLPPLIKIIKYI